MALCSKFNLFTKDKRHGGALGVSLIPGGEPTFSAFIVKVNCEASDITVYREYSDTILTVGDVIYEDADLTVVYSGDNFIDGVYRYNLTASEITSIEAFTCKVPVTIYTDCFNSNPTTRYVDSISSPFPDGSFLYLGSDGASTATDPAFFSYEGYMYDYNGGTGTTNTGLCFP